MFPQWLLPHVETPVFSIGSIFDSEQIRTEVSTGTYADVAKVNAFGQGLLRVMKEFLLGTNGLGGYVDHFAHHCCMGSWGGSGTFSSAGFDEWGVGHVTSAKLSDVGGGTEAARTASQVFQDFYAHAISGAFSPDDVVFPAFEDFDCARDLALVAPFTEDCGEQMYGNGDGGLGGGGCSDVAAVEV